MPITINTQQIGFKHTDSESIDYPAVLSGFSLNRRVSQYFDTRSDMIRCTELYDGDYVKTTGYYRANDSGGGLYRICNHRGYGINVELDNGRYANLICDSGMVVATQVGIKRNNSAEFDNSIPLMNLYAEYPDYMSNMILYFPIGSYRFLTPIELNNRIYFKGEAPPKPYMSYDSKTVTETIAGNATMFIYQVPNSTLLTVDYPSGYACTIENITFYGRSTRFHQDLSNTIRPVDSPNAYNPISFEDMIENVNGVYIKEKGAIIKGCHFNGFSGVAIKVGQLNTVDSCSATGCRISLYVTGPDGIYRNNYFANGVTAIYVEDYHGVFIWNQWIDLMQEYGLYAEKGVYGIIDSVIDRTGYASICTKSSVQGFDIRGRFTNAGMYHAFSKQHPMDVDSMLLDIDNNSDLSAAQKDDLKFELLSKMSCIAIKSGRNVSCKAEIFPRILNADYENVNADEEIFVSPKYIFAGKYLNNSVFTGCETSSLVANGLSSAITNASYFSSESNAITISSSNAVASFYVASITNGPQRIAISNQDHGTIVLTGFYPCHTQLFLQVNIVISSYTATNGDVLYLLSDSAFRKYFPSFSMFSFPLYGSDGVPYAIVYKNTYESLKITCIRDCNRVRIQGSC